MTTTLALMRTELTLLRRNTTAWTTAVAIPFMIGAFWAVSDTPFGDGVAALVTLQVTVLLVFTLHTVGTMLLASRREQLVLKRWRTSQAGTVGVLGGSLGVLAGLLVLQAVALILITAVLSGATPANVPLLATGIIAGIALVGAITFVVAAFTRSPEHAMITTFPVFLLLAGGAVWAVSRPFDPLDWAVLALPGGAVTQLLHLGWNGLEGTGPGAWLAQVGPSLAATAGFTAVAVAVAVRCFRWEPRA